MRHFASLLALLAAPLAAAPQDLCEGNGLGSSYIDHGPVRIGGLLEVNIGSPTQPGGLAFLSLSGGAGPTTSPIGIVGDVCLDVTSPLYKIFPRTLDGTGNHQFLFSLPTNPAFVQVPPFFGNSAVFEPGLPKLSMSKTVRIAWHNTGGFNPAGALTAGRAGHTATSLNADPRDNRTKVFLAGGGGGTLLAPTAVATTEVYDPVSRAFTAGPTMNTERVFHAAVRLLDGRVLITGGVNSAGVATNGCELFDLDAGTMAATGSMASPRVGHAITLLGNGKVLVTGGLTDYVDAENRFLAVMNTAVSTGELYDPSTGNWTVVPGSMQLGRVGHTQTTLTDGRVLIVAGANGAVQSFFGGEVPLVTPTCDFYDPAANAFSPAPSISLSTAFHAASLLDNGNVLVTGGLTSDISFGFVDAHGEARIFNGTSWTVAPGMTTSRYFHRQVPASDGSALVFGGFTGSFFTPAVTASVGRHDGAAYTTGTDIGVDLGIPGSSASARGSHRVTELYDGSFLITGGSPGTTTSLADAFSHID